MSVIQKTIDDITRTKTLLDQTERIPGRDDTGDFKITFANLQESLTTTVPAGTVIESAAISAPTGFLPAAGGSYSRTTYDVLFAAITADKGTATISIASPGVVTLSTHGLSTGHAIELTTTGALPTGLSVNTNYYVIYNDANSFWLATSYDNAIAGTKINTSGSQSGVHNLRFTPFGIDTSANFKVPNRQAVVGKGAGTQTINTRSKTAPVLGAIEEDRGQGHYHTEYVASSAGSSSVWSASYQSSRSTVLAAVSESLTREQITDGTNGTPRTGATTRENSIGMNYYIKY